MESPTPESWLASVHALFDHAADGAWVSGERGEIRYWNRAAEAIMGHTTAQAVGQPCGAVFCGRDSNGNGICAWPCPIKGLMGSTGQVKSFDMLTRTRSGRAVWINVSNVGRPAGEGVPIILHIFRDVTAAHEIDALVRHQLAAAEGGPPIWAAHTPLAELTRRELEILGLMRGGADTQAVAQQLFISTSTVRNHVQSILRKLDVHSRLEAVAMLNRLTTGPAARLAPPGVSPTRGGGRPSTVRTRPR